ARGPRPHADGGKDRMKRFLKWVFGIVDVVVIAVVTLVFVRACDARGKPPLEKWHGTLASEVRARDLGPAVGLADYIRLEDAVFAEMEKTVVITGAADAKTRYNRYAAEGAVNPLRFPKNWNRTY